MTETKTFDQLDLIMEALRKRGIQIDGRNIEFTDREEIVDGIEIQRTYVHVEKKDGTQGPEYLLDNLL